MSNWPTSLNINWHLLPRHKHQHYYVNHQFPSIIARSYCTVLKTSMFSPCGRGVRKKGTYWGITLTLQSHRRQNVFQSSCELQNRLWVRHQAPHRSGLASLFSLRVLKEGRHFFKKLICSSWLQLWLTFYVIKGKITFWFSPKSLACLSVSDLPWLGMSDGS